MSNSYRGKRHKPFKTLWLALETNKQTKISQKLLSGAEISNPGLFKPKTSKSLGIGMCVSLAFPI